MKSGNTKVITKEKKEINSLAKLLQSIDWVQIETFRHVNKLQPDQMSVAFGKPNKEAELANKVTMRIGRDILIKMGWGAGDRIEVFYDPDYIFRFLLTKSDKGRKISIEPDSGYGNFSVPWRHPKIPLEPMSACAVAYEVYEGYLSFCADEANYLK